MGRLHVSRIICTNKLWHLKRQTTKRPHGGCLWEKCAKTGVFCYLYCTCTPPRPNSIRLHILLHYRLASSSVSLHWHAYNASTRTHTQRHPKSNQYDARDAQTVGGYFNAEKKKKTKTTATKKQKVRTKFIKKRRQRWRNNEPIVSSLIVPHSLCHIQSYRNRMNFGWLGFAASICHALCACCTLPYLYIYIFHAK